MGMSVVMIFNSAEPKEVLLQFMSTHTPPPHTHTKHTHKHTYHSILLILPMLTQWVGA